MTPPERLATRIRVEVALARARPRRREGRASPGSTPPSTTSGCAAARAPARVTARNRRGRPRPVHRDPRGGPSSWPASRAASTAWRSGPGWPSTPPASATPTSTSATDSGIARRALRERRAMARGLAPRPATASSRRPADRRARRPAAAAAPHGPATSPAVEHPARGGRASRARSPSGCGPCAATTPRPTSGRSPSSRRRSVAAERDATLVTFHEVRGTRRAPRHRRGVGAPRACSDPSVRSPAATSRLTSDVRAAAVARPSMAAFLARARDVLPARGRRRSCCAGWTPTGRSSSSRPSAWRRCPGAPCPPCASTRSSPRPRPPPGCAVRRSRPRAPVVAALAGPGPAARPRGGGQSVARAWGRHTGRGPVTTTTRVCRERGRALRARLGERRAPRGARAPRRPEPAVLVARHGRRAGVRPRARGRRSPPSSSCCRRATSAEAADGSGDEPLGLAAALLGLGVQCVVAATNPVHDDVAAAAMVDLHQRLVDGTDVATALQQTARRGPGRRGVLRLRQHLVPP